MAKTILFDYTFDASAKTITVTDTYDQKRFLLITNVNTGEIIYNFADSAKGASFEYIYEPTPSTVLTLNYDTTSMADTDPLQIFYDSDAVKMEPSSTFLDPVSKIRVSTPENLIDTDFEYGLQSTKWETLENTANIPTFFSRSGEVSYNLTDITASNGSDLITVITADPHNLQRGTPIIIVGTTQITCDGGFIVTDVLDENTFVYRAKAEQALSGSIKEENTFVFPAGLYSGTEFKVTGVGAITTDSASDSTLTANLQYPANFTENTSFSISNSFANVAVPFDTDDVNIGSITSTSQTLTSNAALTRDSNPWHLGRYSYMNYIPESNLVSAANWGANWFREGTSDITVDTTNNTVTFANPHNCVTGDAVCYLVDSNTTPIGGLTANRAYFVERVNDYTLKFYSDIWSSFNTPTIISLTSSGTNSGMTKSLIAKGIMCESTYYFRRRNRRWGWGSTTSYINVYQNSNSDYHSLVLGTSQGDPSLVIRPIYEATNNASFNPSTPNLTSGRRTITSDNAAGLRETGLTYYFRRGNTTGSTIELRFTASGGDTTVTGDTVDLFVLPIGDGALGNFTDRQYIDQIRLDNHGYSGGDLLIASTPSGQTSVPSISNSSYIVQKVDDDYIKLLDTGGLQVNLGLNGTPTSSSQVEFSQTSIDPNGDTIAVAAGSENTLSNGKIFTYSNSGGTSIGGLVDGTDYYMARVSGNRFNVSTTQNTITNISYNIDHRFDIGIDNNIIQANHALNTGDAVLYTTNDTPITGLVNDTIYYIRDTASNSFKLYGSSADAANDTNRIALVVDQVDNSRSSTFTKVNIVDLTSKPATNESHGLGTNAIGSADGVYTLRSMGLNKTSFEMGAGFQVLPRNLTLTSQDSFIASLNGFFKEDHGLVTGDVAEVTIDETAGSANITGITSGNSYYIIGDSNQFFRLAATYDDALAGTAVALSETSTATTNNLGTITIKADTIVGKFAGEGTVDIENGFNTVIGDGTTLNAYFINGDTIEIDKSPLVQVNAAGTVSATASTDILTFSSNHFLTTGDPVVLDDGTGTIPTPLIGHRVYFARARSATEISLHFTASDATADTNRVGMTGNGTAGFKVLLIDGTGSIIERTIDYVNGADRITVTEPFTETLTDAKFLLRTRLLLRNDGFALHRPYDGGVELIPSTNPDSQMIRQTRKYFRYQSGKGIQVSFAVNFSPSTQIETFTTAQEVDSDSGQNITRGTIKTRYPHRLSEGTIIKTYGATNVKDTISDVYVPVKVFNGAFLYDNNSTPNITELLRGRTYRFIQEDSSNSGYTLRFSTEVDGGSPENEYTTGVTVNGTAGTTGAYTEITVAANAPSNLYIYVSGTSGFNTAFTIADDPENGQRILYNDEFFIDSVDDDYTVSFIMAGDPTEITAKGSVEYYVKEWQNSQLKCGLFDDQNGIFFEYNGQELFCCRRSATKQISGYNNVNFRSGTITGVNTSYLSQLTVGERIVIRGQLYEITRIDSDTQFHVLPTYRGKSSSRVIISKVETVKVPQSQWNIDKADGTGRSGFKLDIHKIQMAYIDYSWYGAGKVRFGFKDQNGDVKYVHSFAHGNYLTEAYMRSGNVPARYEIQNTGQPSYVPALAHWGTSVIMDGRFDPDRAYIFNANSNAIALTNAAQSTFVGDIEITSPYYVRRNGSMLFLGYAIEVTPSTTFNSFVARDPITGLGLDTGTELTTVNPSITNLSTYGPYMPKVYASRTTNKDDRDYYDLLMIDKAPLSTQTGQTYTVGSAGSGIEVTKTVPLLSIRLAPSVDNSNTGALGVREIINRMQLILSNCSILTTHAVDVNLLLNGTLNVNEWKGVQRPSLSELITHSSADTVTGGESVFNFRCQGDTGTTRAPQLTEQDLSGIATLGNSILGGNNVFPDGPDVLTVTATLVEDPSTVSATTPFVITARIGWSESQA